MKKNLLLLPALLLLLSACKTNDDIPAPDLSGQQLSGPLSLTTSPSPATVVADGVETITLTLSGGADAAKKFATATFSVSPIGRFVGGDSVISAPLDAAGNAVVQLRSFQQAGEAIVRAAIGGYRVQQIVTFTRPTRVDTLRLSVLRDNVPADNYSYAHVQAAAIDPALITVSKTITFTTDKGLFTNGQQSITVNAGLDGVADAYLRHNKAERAIITATIAGAYTRQAAVTFLQAWPQLITVNPAAAIISKQPGASVNVTTNLSRSAGVPGDGILVEFRDSAASTGQSVGTFVNVTRSNAAQATAAYTIQDTAGLSGYIYLISTVDTGGGTVRGVNRVWVQ